MLKEQFSTETASQYQTYLEIQQLLLGKHKNGVRTGVIFLIVGISVPMLPTPWKIIGWLLIMGGLMGLSIGIYGWSLARKVVTIEEFQNGENPSSPNGIKKLVKILAVVVWGILSLLMFVVGTMWILVISNK